MRVTINENDKKWLSDFENWLFFQLYVAYLQARRGGKRGTFDMHKIEAFEFPDLLKLWKAILNRAYRPSRGTAHVNYVPVDREVVAAPFIDRIVHHYIYNVIYDWWDRRFIYDSYSCRVGKGTKIGRDRLAHFIQSASDNYSKKVYVIKMDIKGYFVSIPRQLLYERVIWGLDKQFEDNKGAIYQVTKFLIGQIIFDDPVKGIRKKGWPEDWRTLPKSKSLILSRVPGVGIVIGNLTSQLFSNIYLDQLDRYITLELGWKRYGRYVDDFFIVVTEDELPRARADIERIGRFLGRMKLELHPNKTKILPIEKGVDFLGGVIYPGVQYPGRRTIWNARVAFSETVEGARDIESVISYMGHMKHFSSDKILKELFESVGWDYEF